MTDEDRASFSNLILLCKPHHDLVDRVRPAEYSPELLMQWKVAREGNAAESLSPLALANDNALGELLEDIVARLGPFREIEVDLTGGILINDGVLAVPIGGWKEALKLNPHLEDELVLAITARNKGTASAYIEGFDLSYELDRDGGPQPQVQLMGRNDFPYLNPTLPKEVAGGASVTWVTSLTTVQWIQERVASTGLTIGSFWAEVKLGSGERVLSEKFAAAELPID